jgi:hypothetical protein
VISTPGWSEIVETTEEGRAEAAWSVEPVAGREMQLTICLRERTRVRERGGKGEREVPAAGEPDSNVRERSKRSRAAWETIVRSVSGG